MADALNAFTKRHGLRFASIRRLSPGETDPGVVRLCAQQGFQAVATANVRDFGARLPLYQDLLAAAISVIVVRPGRATLAPELQLKILITHARKVSEALMGSQPLLLRLTPTDARERTLDELISEIAGPGCLLS